MAWRLVAFRLREETMEKVDGLLPGLSTRAREATRSDSLRYLILVGLARAESERPLRMAAASVGGQKEEG